MIDQRLITYQHKLPSNEIKLESFIITLPKTILALKTYQIYYRSKEKKLITTGL